MTVENPLQVGIFKIGRKAGRRSGHGSGAGGVDLVAERAAVGDGSCRHPPVSGQKACILIIGSLPIGGMGLGIRVTGSAGAIADPAVINRDKAAVKIISRTAVTVTAVQLVRFGLRAMISGGIVGGGVGCRRRRAVIRGKMAAGQGKTAGSGPTLKIGAMAAGGGTAGPAQLGGKALMAGNYIRSPAGRMGAKWRSGRMAGQAADSHGTAAIIGSMANLA